jgi:hypothetical protein
MCGNSLPRAGTSTCSGEVARSLYRAVLKEPFISLAAAVGGLHPCLRSNCL